MTQDLQPGHESLRLVSAQEVARCVVITLDHLTPNIEVCARAVVETTGLELSNTMVV